MFSIRMSPLKTVKRTICEVLKEGEGETCQVDCSLRVRGGAATSLMFVFVSLETSDSAASRQQMFSSVCVYGAEEWSYKTCEKVFLLVG